MALFGSPRITAARIIRSRSVRSLGSSAFLDFDAVAPTLDAAAEADATVFVHPEAGRASGDARPEWWEWVVSLGAGFALVALVWFVAARLYHREQLATSA